MSMDAFNSVDLIDNGFRTDIGKLGFGQQTNDKLPRVAEHINDIFLTATREHLGMSMIVGAFCSARITKLLRDYTVDTPELIEGYLRRNPERTLRLLIWQKPNPSGAIVVAREFVRLAREYPNFELRTSATDDLGDQIGHFIVATNRKDRWVVRLEQPHEPSNAELFPAMNSYSDPNNPKLLASVYGTKLLGLFDSLWTNATLINVQICG